MVNGRLSDGFVFRSTFRESAMAIEEKSVDCDVANQKKD
jgi:hypothetical protein